MKGIGPLTIFIKFSVLHFSNNLLTITCLNNFNELFKIKSSLVSLSLVLYPVLEHLFKTLCVVIK